MKETKAQIEWKLGDLEKSSSSSEYSLSRYSDEEDEDEAISANELKNK